MSHLSATRRRLLEVQKQLRSPLQESDRFLSKKIVKENGRVCKDTLDAIAKDLQKVDNLIDKIIADDQELNRVFGLVTSVSGIGKVTATQIIIATNEFKGIDDPKKFACYAGVAPFPRESGLFKGKSRVSHQANKCVKSLLHMSALSAIEHNPDLKIYYERKVKEEKKNKMLVINAVRNKLILRIFACVKQNRKYEKNYTRLVA